MIRKVFQTALTRFDVLQRYFMQVSIRKKGRCLFREQIVTKRLPQNIASRFRSANIVIGAIKVRSDSSQKLLSSINIDSVCQLDNFKIGHHFNCAKLFGTFKKLFFEELLRRTEGFRD